MSALVLLAHGSARNPESCLPTLQLQEAFREECAFSEVRVGFWRQAPSWREAFEGLEGHEIHVIPLFFAEGWFTGTVIPDFLGELSIPEERLRLYPPLGVMEGMAALVNKVALREAEGFSAPERASLVMVGHGTPRNPTSRASTRALCQKLRALGGFGEVLEAFTDDDPLVDEVLGRVGFERALVIPFMLANGYHGGETIPDSLARSGARRMYKVTRSVGTQPEVKDLLLGQMAPGGRGGRRDV